MQDASGKLVYYLYQAILYHIINIDMEELVGSQGLGKVMDVLKIFFVKNKTLYETPPLQE
ncbi:hypothetical protein MASR2M78_00850 [Treponema sp.]